MRLLTTENNVVTVEPFIDYLKKQTIKKQYLKYPYVQIINTIGTE